MPVRSYAGAAKRTTLAGDITATSTNILVVDATGYPTGVDGPFAIALALGNAAEEKILIASRSGNTLTVATGGRGYDGTSAAEHRTGVSVDHVLTATDVREANAHVNDTAGDPHPQYLTPTEANAAYVPSQIVTGAGVDKTGAADSTAAIQAKIDAAAAIGGVVFFPAGRYKVTGLNLPAGVTLVGEQTVFSAAPSFGGSILEGSSATTDVITLTDRGGFYSSYALRHLKILGGRDGISITGVRTFVDLYDVEVAVTNRDGIHCEGQVEELHFRLVRLSGCVRDGFNFTPTPNVNNLSYLDKCHFDSVYAAGNGRSGWYLQAKNGGNSNTWTQPNVTTNGQHGIVIDGPWSQQLFVNLNTEGNGRSGKSNRTTASTTNGSADITVASATGLAVGDILTVARAGGNGADLSAAINAISGTTVTLAAAASKTLSSTAVTNAVYDDVHFANTQGSSSPVLTTFVSGRIGGEGIGHLRYCVHGEQSTATSFFGTFTADDFPVYDPFANATVMGGVLNVRTSYDLVKDFRAPVITSKDADRTNIPSPPGRPINLGLIPDGGGAFGNVEIRQSNPGRTRIVFVDGATGDIHAVIGKVFATKGLALDTVAATTLGSVIRRVQVYDANGNAIGFVPVYNNIT